MLPRYVSSQARTSLAAYTKEGLLDVGAGERSPPELPLLMPAETTLSGAQHGTLRSLGPAAVGVKLTCFEGI